MITLLASICGFIGSLCPEIIKIFFDKNNHKYRLELLEMQGKLIEKGINAKISEIQQYKEINEINNIYKTYTSGIDWVDALNGTVRPVLAYFFFLIYCFTKFLQFYVIYNNSVSQDLIQALWNPEDQAIFAGIISFYYGQRAIAKIRGRK